MKWGEYSSDVQFMLQRSDQIKTDSKAATLPNAVNKSATSSVAAAAGEVRSGIR